VNGSYLAGGPGVWLVTIVITTLLLVASTQGAVARRAAPHRDHPVLHVFPIVRRLALSGLGRETAAAIVAGVRDGSRRSW
jgi:hypothetical protein